MDPQKFVELQKQMRENNEEVADFLKDLKAWRSQVATQEARLSQQKPRDTKLPAIRNTLFKKQRKKKTNATPPPKSADRIKGHDYRAWDKFNVEAALEAVDHASASLSDASSSETDQELENRRRISLAAEARDLGNQRFKEEQFAEAVEHYTTAIRLAPEDPTLLTNRALAHLKLERYASAEMDCSSALVLDNMHAKALFRRAIARKHLGKRAEAIQDLELLLKSNPSNKPAMAELTSILGPTTPLMNPMPLDSPTKAPSRQSGPLNGVRKFKRITIMEVGGVYSNGTATKAEQTWVTKAASSHGHLFDEPSGDSLVPARPPQIKCSHDQPSNNGDHPSGSVIPSSLPLPFPTEPENWFQLERDLRELNGCESRSTLTASAITYLCRICPTRYVKVIGSNVEATFLAQLLRAFNESNSLSSSDLVARLDQLSRLPRFDVAWMLTDDTTRQLFRNLCDRLQSDHEVCTDQLKHIKNAFLC